MKAYETRLTWFQVIMHDKLNTGVGEYLASCLVDNKEA